MTESPPLFVLRLRSYTPSDCGISVNGGLAGSGDGLIMAEVCRSSRSRTRFLSGLYL